jgi:hypothetical protein
VDGDNAIVEPDREGVAELFVQFFRFELRRVEIEKGQALEALA